MWLQLKEKAEERNISLSDYYRLVHQACKMPHFAYFLENFTEVCNPENLKKVQKTGQSTAFQEEKYNDKSIICLPRQYLP